MKAFTTSIRTFLYNEENASRVLKVASVAMTCDRDTHITRAKIIETIVTIMESHPDVELVVLGEMILGWYDPGGMQEYHRHISESVPGKSTQVFASLAQKYGIYICFGLSELDGNTIFNSQVLLNPKGEGQAVHRKRNLKSGEKIANYQPGAVRVTTTEIKNIRTGIVICSDTASLRTMRELMKRDLDLIIHSLADDDRDDFVTRFQARMYDSWLVTANRYGKEAKHVWPGLIVLTDPLGKIRITKQGQEQYLVYKMRFAEKGSGLKQLVRNIRVKAPVIPLVLKNLDKVKSYL